MPVLFFMMHAWHATPLSVAARLRAATFRRYADAAAAAAATITLRHTLIIFHAAIIFALSYARRHALIAALMPAPCLLPRHTPTLTLICLAVCVIDAAMRRAYSPPCLSCASHGYLPPLFVFLPVTSCCRYDAI